MWGFGATRNTTLMTSKKFLAVGIIYNIFTIFMDPSAAWTLDPFTVSAGIICIQSIARTPVKIYAVINCFWCLRPWFVVQCSTINWGGCGSHSFSRCWCFSCLLLSLLSSLPSFLLLLCLLPCFLSCLAHSSAFLCNFSCSFFSPFPTCAFLFLLLFLDFLLFQQIKALVVRTQAPLCFLVLGLDGFVSRREGKKRGIKLGWVSTWGWRTCF